LSPPANRSENRSVYQSRSRGWVIFTLPQPLQVGQFSVTTIKIFYNRQRKQARLGFLSPVAFERWFYEKRLAA
ncbi:MAG: hypothetical protein M0P04_03780, partial [Syntrophales bacterium]|nr:hypothetical protein [Syntrophales bacterium]